MTTLWMIEDLEFWPDEPAPGQVCEPTTYWAVPGMTECVAELVHHVYAWVEEITVDGRVEQLAHLGHGFTTMLPQRLDTVGNVTLTGHLVWDRYLWTVYRTQPAGRALVTERRPVIQRAVGPPAGYVGWYSVEYEGPKIVHRDGPVPEGYSIVAYALSVILQ